MGARLATLLFRSTLTGVIALASLFTITLIAAPTAAAMPGPSFFARGFTDEAPSAGPNDGSLLAEHLGSAWTRVEVDWAQIAPRVLRPGFKPADPSDPRYGFAVLDAYVEDAVAHRQQVILMTLDAPRWSEENPPPHAPPGTWRPDPAALGAFARALAIRYSGHFPDPLHQGATLPRVAYFQAWNEPNLPVALSPQWTRGRNGQFLPASPAFYRNMLNAFYNNVKAIQPHAYVLAAGTAPYGDPAGRGRMAPVIFLREMLCLHGSGLRPERCLTPAHFDAIDHHPYALSPTIHANFNADDVSVTDLGRLKRVLAKAEHTHRALPAGPKAIWVTEIGWDSDPPDHSPVSLALQARYVALAFYELWRQGVGHVFWLLVSDPKPGSGTVPALGVYFFNARAKPSAAAYRFPFVALPDNRGVVTLWGLAPKNGVVSIQVLRHRRWRAVAQLRTTRHAVFYARRALGRHLLLRAVVGRTDSPPWATG